MKRTLIGDNNKRLWLLAAILLFPLFVMAQNRKKVAVYVMGEDVGINKVLESKLVYAISSSIGFTAIERTEAFLAELNKEQKYQRTGAVDDNEFSRLGRQFGVQYVCVASVSEVFNEKYLSARLIDVESAQVEYTASSSGTIGSLPDAINAAEIVSKDLLSSLGKSKQSDAHKVAVYVAKNEASRNIGRVFGDKLVAALTTSGRYIAVERTNSFLQQLSKEQTYQRTGVVDDNEISRLGKQFGVQLVCVVDISNVFGEKFISARLINVETAEVVNTHDVGGEINNMETCIRMADEIANNLSKGTFTEQARINRKVASELKQASSSNALITYFLGDRHDRYVDLNGNYVDLGLPSGILWKSTNETELYDYYSAMDKFGNKLPTVEQWEELKKYCTWEWTENGYKIIGPNNNYIFICATKRNNPAAENYWAYKYGVSESSARCYHFSPNDVSISSKISTDPCAVCLVDAATEESLKVIYRGKPSLYQEELDSIYNVSVIDPEFPGGIEAMSAFLKENVCYPDSAKEWGIQGTVFYSFIVEKSGRITNIEILKSPIGGFCEEMIRVLKLMPRWKPDQNENHTVRSRFTCCLKFILR